MIRSRIDAPAPVRALGAVPRRLAMVLGTALGAVLPSAAAPAAPQADQAALDFFEANVRPVLVEHCYSCHSAEAPRLRGDLALDTREGLLRGGALGPALVPGDPDASLLLEAVRYEDELLRMPPSGKLPDRVIEHLTRWVEMGAPDPRASDGPPADDPEADDASSRAEALWSFHPPTEPEVPRVDLETWPRSDLDRFVLARLEENGLSPAPEADRRTLIRRVSFDLTGLPPTPDEVAAFLDDDRPDAFARVVDRLLASPAYGERWGRHWLDLARYADSNGLDENVAHGHAWRYRDYVVDAFNRDVPYDRFVVEQLAGDLLPDPGPAPERHAQLIATGFLTLGPKVLAEPDQVKMKMDIVDEQLDTVGRTFLGLTIGCARCHDHKFDPITAADYYAMAGIFTSTTTMDSFETVAKWHENPIPTAEDLRLKEAHDARVASKEAEIEAAAEAANARLVAEGDEGFTLPETPESLYSDEEKARLEALRAELATLQESAPELPAAMGVAEGTAEDIPIHIRGSHLTLGDLVPRRVPEQLAGPEPPTIAPDRSGRLELARWIADEGHPLTARVMVNRIWRWHFGEGLVDTPDNFGALGGSPSHPMLLDWLALRFADEGWSIKSMHRLIMNSSTYRMGSDHDPRAAAVDPGNRLLWRSNVRRLESEAIRDALLAASGALDRAVGGSLLTVENRDYFFNHTSKDVTDYDSARRSLYLPVVRNHLYDLFQLFDSTDASVPDGDRATTTVAPQALFLMNSGLVLDVAGDLAADLLGRADLDDPARLRILYERAYGRPPSAEETDRALAYLDRLAGELDDAHDTTRLDAWQALCQVVLASDEFVYIR
ncbi:PSD1 and planctomycete cytochrome C domain-containing protein [Tautonia plasticadhaerens]|uniref:Planctomycete cytochrome C n=1 Tax=Tautonia plasticadhaerens TaxID=2527974 RepID=A0A518H376_9BACT|nr:PSD1 and planctomycete cytochrome C domain-containing protein [Tautonia plasticadhaerens]QDV35295.1 Planctomycete cytochrome C [Tautonia plasticadhaerens]